MRSVGMYIGAIFQSEMKTRIKNADIKEMIVDNIAYKARVNGRDLILNILYLEYRRERTLLKYLVT